MKLYFDRYLELVITARISALVHGDSRWMTAHEECMAIRKGFFSLILGGVNPTQRIQIAIRCLTGNRAILFHSTEYSSISCKIHRIVIVVIPF